MTEEGKFDPTKAFNIVEPPKMDVETQTEEGFFGRAFRGITGAPSQQELAETDPSRLNTDIREASVNLNKIYNPLDFDDSAWNKAYKSFADSKNIQLGMTPTGQYSLENLQKAKGEVKDKLMIINTLRQYQAYTEDDIGGITGHVEDIYKEARKSGDQFTTVVTQIAKDMNETSVSDVMSNLDQYVPEKGGSETGNGAGVAQTGITDGIVPTPGQPEPTESGIDSGLRQALTDQVESGKAINIQTDDKKPPVYEIEHYGKTYQIEISVPGKPRILKTEG
jgi:hypothetical protein